MSAVARAVACCALLFAAACGASGEDPRQQPRDGRAGVQFSGTLEGRQVAVRDGAPELVVADCDPRTPPDDDVCVITQTIGGELFVLVFENPAVLASGASLEVAGSPCRGSQCDDIDDHAVVDVQIGAGNRIRARGGEIELREVEPFLYYSGKLRLEFANGTLSGDFDLVPRPD